MSDRTLADLAEEYEETAKILEKQLEEIDEQLKLHRYGAKHNDLTTKRYVLADMLFDVKVQANTLKTYYDK